MHACFSHSNSFNHVILLFQVSQVHDNEKGNLTSSIRTQIGSSIRDDESLLVKKISQRVGKAVKLEVMEKESVHSSEAWTIGVYSVGGYYAPHMDPYNMSFSNITTNHSKVNDFDLLTDDRMASVLLYHSDVIGGVTAFERLGLGVSPKRGSALFWHNLHSNGTVDARMLHSACPTALGIKWVSNKWIWSREQVWKRPCFAQEESTQEESRLD